MGGARLRVWLVLVVVGGGLCVEASAPAHLYRQSSDPVLRAITHAARRGALDRVQAGAYRQAYADAVGEVGRLSGSRAGELRAAIAIVRGIAARGALDASRMPLVFLTLVRNTQWWSSHGPPPAGAGLEPAAQGRHCRPLAGPLARAANLTFEGSGIVYEYYPGLGLQLQVNATFGSANALLSQDTPASLAGAEAILDQMLTLASSRRGRLAWEYEFPFDGALPPWTSGLSQATAIEALTRASSALGRPDYLRVALRLARLFANPPPRGVRVHLSGGDWFLLYSFAPHEIVLNADLDSLIALHDLSVVTHAPFLATLERRGLRALKRNIARFDIGQWSLYAKGGPLANLNYQAVNFELAERLCGQTGTAAVCRAARSFDRELNARCPRIKHSSGGQASETQPRADRVQPAGAGH